MRHRRIFRNATLCTLASAIGLLVGGCVGSSNGGDQGGGSTQTAAVVPAADSSGGRASDAARTYPLGSLPTSTVTIGDHVFRVWIAHESAPRSAGALRDPIEEGLMFVPSDEIEDDQGMLFVFTDERIRGFWMLNTIAPLDIAFARTDGTIVKIWRMPPRTLQTFSSIEPAMFALEVKQGTFAQLGIVEGDRLVIPEDALVYTP